jgi:hypothetical protein
VAPFGVPFVVKGPHSARRAPYLYLFFWPDFLRIFASLPTCAVTSWISAVSCCTMGVTSTGLSPTGGRPR